MRKVISVIMTVLLIGTSVFAEDNIKVLINNKEVAFDVPPQTINYRTMVPMRKIFETLGAKVDWHDEAQLIIATKNELVIAMEIGKADFSVTNVISGETKKIELDSVPVLVNDRTLVPARAVSESLGYDVDWVEESQTVLITG